MRHSTQSLIRAMRARAASNSRSGSVDRSYTAPLNAAAGPASAPPRSLHRNTSGSRSAGTEILGTPHSRTCGWDRGARPPLTFGPMQETLEQLLARLKAEIHDAEHGDVDRAELSRLAKAVEAKL